MHLWQLLNALNRIRYNRKGRNSVNPILITAFLDTSSNLSATKVKLDNRDFLPDLGCGTSDGDDEHDMLDICFDKIVVSMASTSITNNVPSLPNSNFEIFDGKDFSRWRGKMKFFLRRLKLAYALEMPCPEAPSSEEIWDTLKAIHLAEEASSKKFLVSNYMEFKMVDDKSITEQVQEFQLIANKIVINGIALDENFHQIEQETRYRDNNILRELIMKAHVVEEKIKKEPGNNKFLKAKKSKNFKRINSNSKSIECYHCHKIGHYAQDYKILKAEKKKEKANNNIKNELVAMVTEAFVAGDQVE
nr:uncharacterized protein LOC104644915 [Solanum lycopersicum]